MLAILATVSALALAPGTRTLQFVPAARPRAARPLTMRIFDDAEKWIGDNLGAITKKKPMGGGSGWASLSRYEVAGMDADIVVKASGNKRSNPCSSASPRAQGPGASRRRSRRSTTWRTAEGGSYFVMDYLSSRAGGPDALWPQDGGDAPGRAAGQEAKAGRFGFDVDNTCGDTPQLSSWTEGSGTDAWVESTASSASGTRSAARAARN